MTIEPVQVEESRLPGMDTWATSVEYRAGLVLSEMLALDSWARTTDATDSDRVRMFRPYQAELRGLYGTEMQFAKLVDRSDLVVRLTGPDADADADSPHVQTLVRTLNQWRSVITRLARELARLDGMSALEKIDVAFAGLARGSLAVGFSVPRPDDVARLAGVVGDDAPYRAVRSAVRLLSDVARGAAGKGQADAGSSMVDRIEKEAQTPGLRDLTLTSIHQLSPSVQSGITRVDLLGRDRPGATLTVQVRRDAHEALRATQLRPRESAAFRGVVREIVLDEHRLELRQVDGVVGSIRCAYPSIVPDASARAWLDQVVEVRGGVERDRGGLPSMLWAQDIIPVGSPEDA